MNFFEKHKNFADNVNRYINMGKNIGFIFTGFLSFITKILENEKISTFLLEHFSFLTNILNYLMNSKAVIYIIFAILALIIIIKLFYNAFLCKAKSIKSMLELVTMIHKDFVHDIRSKMVEMDACLMDRLIRAKNNNEDITNVYNNELDKLKETIQPYVTILGDYLSEYRNKKISVCIKTFANGRANRGEYMDEELITIARSANTKNARNTKHRSIVRNNTDFIDLCYGQSTFYGKHNLKKLYDDGIYKNDSPKWWKKYNSTLVAPIRYYNKDKNTQNVNIDIDVIGFLCIDCKDNILEWENSDSFELQLLAIIADSLYTYIRKFYNCFEEVGYFDVVKEGM